MNTQWGYNGIAFDFGLEKFGINTNGLKEVPKRNSISGWRHGGGALKSNDDVPEENLLEK